ncbi:MAG: hypothetical protein A3J95_04675 [Candidatus Komeilibacteria bacterium RIFOXYC2_FULL_45_12]|nr:MAG: hypothetical protein A3J95_04675 [Candidatus Komeilibacteria bacterium RIFOXYC2_FULL_45_12]
MEFDYTVTTQKDFDSAVLVVQEETAKAGFRVLYVHDVHKTLDEKGFKIEPMKIIEFCNAKSAYAVLQEDAKIGLCLPCKILVYTKDGKTIISGMRPIILSKFFPKSQLGTLPEEIDALIKVVIDNSK